MPLPKSPKSTEFVPVMLMFEIASGALPVLVSVTFCVGLVDPMFTLPKLRLVGGAVAEHDRDVVGSAD
jgi:hypothetical protein